jgi:predicted protein tyrosine phosphatase
MEPAPIQILSRAAFDLMLLSAGRHWVASIREQEADPIPRSEFFGNRINLAFYDLTDGPNIATAAHVEKVYRFSQRWAKAAHSDPTTASLVVHCFAGISRSSAIAMIPLLLYYRSEKAPAKRLYEINRWAAPNTHVLYGEREILGGQAAFLACARGRKSGYQRRKVFSHSSSSTRVLICRRRCAPRWLHPICCFFTIRLLTT